MFTSRVPVSPVSPVSLVSLGALAVALLLGSVPGQDTRRSEPPKPRPDTRAIGFEKQLAPVAFLLGKHEGEGQSQMGRYVEGMVGRWGLGKTTLVLQTVSKAGGQTVFQDMRVFTWDRVQKRIRCRQFAFGGVCTYTVEVKKDGRLVLHQDAIEGMKRPEWRYTIRKGEGRTFSYQVDQKAGEKWQKYVGASLK